MTAVVIVDGAHLFAAAGRSLGVGAQRRGGNFRIGPLIDGLLGLVPGGKADILWFDAGLEDREIVEHRVLRKDPRVQFTLLPLRAGTQRYVVESILLAVMSLTQIDAGDPTYLVGDPRRHSVALQFASERGRTLTIVGVSNGEATPAERMWLRRAQLWRCLAAKGPQAPRLPRADEQPSEGYTSPTLLASRVRLPFPLSHPPVTNGGGQ